MEWILQVASNAAWSALNSVSVRAHEASMFGEELHDAEK